MKLFAIDLNNIGYILGNSNQLHRKGLLKFTDGLRRGLRTRKFVILDDSKPYFRKIFYPDYKANRKPRKVDYKKAMKALRQECEDIICAVPRMEVDDLMGVLARDERLEKLIAVSNDSDFKQFYAFRKFSQFLPQKRSSLKFDRRKCFEKFVTTILKGDEGKDNIKKSHNHRQIRTKKLGPVLDRVFKDVLQASQEAQIRTITDLPLQDIIWQNLSEAWDMDEGKFGINFDLNCLIQPIYAKYLDDLNDEVVLGEIYRKIQA